MLELIPVLDVCKPCEWNEPQKCFHASLWWGEVLMSFYSPEATRLESEVLNALACNILRELTKAIMPGSAEIITPAELQKAMNATPAILCCFWSDFVPCVAERPFGFKNVVSIPAPEPTAMEASNV